jgi:hypothetical protein
MSRTKFATALGGKITRHGLNTGNRRTICKISNNKARPKAEQVDWAINSKIWALHPELRVN